MSLLLNFGETEKVFLRQGKSFQNLPHQAYVLCYLFIWISSEQKDNFEHFPLSLATHILQSSRLSIRNVGILSFRNLNHEFESNLI